MKIRLIQKPELFRTAFKKILYRRFFLILSTQSHLVNSYPLIVIEVFRLVVLHRDPSADRILTFLRLNLKITNFCAS